MTTPTLKHKFFGWREAIGGNDWHMTLGPQGSRNAMFTAVYSVEHGLRFWVGCKHGIDAVEFRALVMETHGYSDHALDYLHAIAFVETHPGLARHRERASTGETATGGG